MKLESLLCQTASVLVLLCCLLPGAHAIGDSGGCGDPLGGPLGQALKTGDAPAIEAVINSWIDNRERSLGTVKKLELKAKGAVAQRAWRNEQALSLIEGRYGKGAVCTAGPVLPVAMNAGNLQGTRYLLDRPFGMKAALPARVLFTCNDGSPAPEQRASRRQTYALVLDTGAIDVNARAGDRGRSALETCFDPQLLSLFMERGATLDTETASRFQVLDQAVEDAVMYEEASYTWRRMYALERAKFFSERLTPSIRGRDVQARVRSICNPSGDRKPRNVESCKALARFIVAAPGTFGER